MDKKVERFFAEASQAVQGAVPKVLTPNLKRIEKLSKQLRSDLAL